MIIYACQHPFPTTLTMIPPLASSWQYMEYIMWCSLLESGILWPYSPDRITRNNPDFPAEA